MDSTATRDERIVRDAVLQIVLGGIGAVVPAPQLGDYKLTGAPGEIRAEIAAGLAQEDFQRTLRRIALALDAQGVEAA